MCVDTSRVPTQTHRDCVFCSLRGKGGGATGFHVAGAGLMKIDSNYVDLKLTVGNDDEGSRILMSGASIVRLHSDVILETRNKRVCPLYC